MLRGAEGWTFSLSTDPESTLGFSEDKPAAQETALYSLPREVGDTRDGWYLLACGGRFSPLGLCLWQIRWNPKKTSYKIRNRCFHSHRESTRQAWPTRDQCHWRREKATFPKAKGRSVTGTTAWMLVSHTYKYSSPETQKRANQNGELLFDV